MEPQTLGPGSVVMAEPGNFDHYFLESLVLILKHDDTGTKGVLLNHGTPWTVEDLSPGATLEPFTATKVFLGGDVGRDTMVMVHGEEMLPGAEEVGKGAYQGGVASAVKAVAAGALPADRFKFFYKSVEWLPSALRLQIDSGTFRVVSLSPAWLFGQSGQRSMWQDVKAKLELAEAKGGKVAPPSEDDLVTGASIGAPRGLPYEGAGLAEEASRGAAQMRSAKEQTEKGEQAEGEQAEEQTEEDQERVRKTATLAHDAKVRAVVEDIKKKNAAKAVAGGGEAAGTADASENLPMAIDAGALAGVKKTERGGGDGAETETAGATKQQTGKGMTGATTAVEAASWLAARGITPPSAESGAAVDAAAVDSAAEPAVDATVVDSIVGAAVDAAVDAAVVEPAGSPGIADVVDYRVYLGSEQWQVRWTGEGGNAPGTSWETWRVLDTESLQNRAAQLRAEKTNTEA